MKYEGEMRDGLESEIDEVVRQRVSFHVIWICWQRAHRPEKAKEEGGEVP